MDRKDSGFTMLELLVVVAIMAVIAGFAIPQAYTALKAYKLHADAAAIGAQLNVTRFRATSQYAPYRLNIDTTNNVFTMERMCGTTPSSTDSNCTGTAAAYQALSTPQIESGTLFLSRGISFTTTNPGGTTHYPGTITGGSAATVFYFNTRGMPVDATGNPVSNGGGAIYLQNQDGLTDAVVVSVGGRITTYNWRPSASTWAAR